MYITNLIKNKEVKEYLKQFIDFPERKLTNEKIDTLGLKNTTLLASAFEIYLVLERIKYKKAKFINNLFCQMRGVTKTPFTDSFCNGLLIICNAKNTIIPVKIKLKKAPIKGKKKAITPNTPNNKKYVACRQNICKDCAHILNPSINCNFFNCILILIKYHYMFKISQLLNESTLKK